VEQLYVLDGKTPEQAAIDILQDFPSPRLVPDRLPFILGSIQLYSVTAKTPVHLPTVHEMSWPLSYLAQLGASSTLGAIQAMELLLQLYENICRAFAHSASDQEKRSALSRISVLRQLVSKAPIVLSTEILQVIAIIQEAVSARNRLVHGEAREGDEEMVAMAHSLAIEQAALVRRIRWSNSNPVLGEASDLTFNASQFCTFSDSTLIMRLGDTEIRSPSTAQ
jgi:hypothetical protein